ncbi:MAG TPA: tRNA threonylcarbamoyladenosine dehydratase [Bacteroidales bacterium]|jgi:tRNA A37 threonylcarbamoyladenosine dehydratase|nr:tRNA threonylcarbamoyladenosine dehydratase [Bacteroidales bacterium]MCZ2416286.1 tRNA threonylcarbamoyladenosine dehydratase [Burkholderiales bacterium]OQC56928.1 MAG: tRNA threonylcarbamoyladenosine dehydratase [Bacteroidetes bacterium ADurb.Bin013]MBP8998700.1 tRNA threonylcarbamoyladenosine dehydratase [Bacteroidales bacterium]MBV6456487.1 tRNA threonylcarbamoyladenosine dehydratase [Bacteroidales bacterium]
MEHWLSRSELLVGKNGLEKLNNSIVLVAGLGGVGSYAAEMLARSGIGHLILADNDIITPTNRNRQLPALTGNEGALKTRVMEDRIRQINPDIVLETVSEYLEEKSIPLLFDQFTPHYVVDAIDTLSPKIVLICYWMGRKTPLVSAMGAGARFDATAVKIDDISHSFNCPLAFMLRKRLRKLGIHKGLKVVFSTELPKEEAIVPLEEKNKKSRVGTISYLPAVFGCLCAQAVICDILEIRTFGR